MAGEQDVEIEEDVPIVIDIGDDDDALAQATAAEAKVPERQLDDGTKALTEQLEAAKQSLALEATGRQEAEARAAEALQYAQAREREVWDASRRETQTQADMVQTGLSGAQSELAAAKQAHRTAFEAGDPDAIADATARMSRAANDIREWERSAGLVAEREQSMRQAPQPIKPQTQQRQPTADEILARNEQNPNLLPREKEWLRAHPDATLDQKRNQRLKVAFDDAIDNGIPRGSEAYFKHLDQFMGYEKAQSTPGSRVSAPVSRGSGGPAARPTTVKLSERDIEIANSMGIRTPEQLKVYARNKLNVPERMKEMNGGIK